MVGLGYFPLAPTFNALISAFCRQGKVSNALKLIDDMVARGCILDIASYNPLVRALCKKGDFQKALGLFTQMVEKGVVPDYYSRTHYFFVCATSLENGSSNLTKVSRSTGSTRLKKGKGHDVTQNNLQTI
ncbi:hypothetical protein CJ030_MR2G013589 [Morella rubra]|uniref:Pentatricopeptide repeat-containing protein, mitochondrial n=1 Tax=Morella rubra TaxID=262757 RepID=A0A6A1WCM3_9ROSI|nr:hypothetical protein CJ030_MR2G013589 [Morella rubra]